MTSCGQLMTLVMAFVMACSDDDPRLGLTKDAGSTSMAGSSDASMAQPGGGGGAGARISTGGRGQGGSGGSGGAANTRGGNGGSGGAAAGGVRASGGITSAGGHAVSGGTGGGTAGASGSMADAAADAPLTACKPDPTLKCDSCIQTKCCPAWLDCANDKNCFGAGGTEGEFICVQNCLVLDDTATLEECAGMCQHGVAVSAATDALIACMRATSGPSMMQNCTEACFSRVLP